MTKARPNIEGTYGEWVWSPMRECYELTIFARIYPMDDGTFCTSYFDVWNTPQKPPKTFKEAEKAALSTY